MSKYYTYRWSAGCETALIEGPGLGHGKEMIGPDDGELVILCATMDQIYEAGLKDGAGLNEAVADVVAPKGIPGFENPDGSRTMLVPLSWFESWHPMETPPDFTETYPDVSAGWPGATNKYAAINEALGFGRGQGKTLFLRLKYLEELMVRSLFHEATGELPTDEAMKPRITVLKRPGGQTDYMLDRHKLGLNEGALLLRKEHGPLGPIDPGENKLRMVFSSPLFTT